MVMRRPEHLAHQDWIADVTDMMGPQVCSLVKPHENPIYKML